MTLTLSVVMCTYNGEQYLRQQLDSLAKQSRLPDELIVCDDRSTDATIHILEEFAAAAPFPVNVHLNNKRLGSTKNFERAIRLSTGDVISLSDQDDVWHPDKLRHIEARFASEPQVGVVFTDAEIVDENLRPIGRRLWEQVGFNQAQQKLMRRGRALEVLLPGWTVTGATMAFSARFKELVLEIPEDTIMIHDAWIALVIAAVARVAFIDEALIKYRQHEQQQIGAPRRDASAADLREKAGLRATLKRIHSYDELIKNGVKLHDRLSTRCHLFNCETAMANLEARLSHLRARANLPAQKMSRLRPILEELRTQRYRLYSNGIYSALKDCLG